LPTQQKNGLLVMLDEKMYVFCWFVVMLNGHYWKKGHLYRFITLHLYRVLYRYKASGTNEGSHLYRARYSVQMPHICTRCSIGPVQISLAPPPGTNEGFIVFKCFFSLTYLLNVLILIIIRCNIKSCGI
jgi:hypothetical protein